MWRDKFSDAADCLRRLGKNPVIGYGDPVSEEWLNSIDKTTDYPMPLELRRFYLEVGNKFYFEPDDRPNSSLSGYDCTWLDDYRVHNTGFHYQIEQEAQLEFQRPKPRVDLAALRMEADRRKKWCRFMVWEEAATISVLTSLLRLVHGYETTKRFIGARNLTRGTLFWPHHLTHFC